MIERVGGFVSEIIVADDLKSERIFSIFGSGSTCKTHSGNAG